MIICRTKWQLPTWLSSVFIPASWFSTNSSTSNAAWRGPNRSYACRSMMSSGFGSSNFGSLSLLKYDIPRKILDHSIKNIPQVFLNTWASLLLYKIYHFNYILCLFAYILSIGFNLHEIKGYVYCCVLNIWHQIWFTVKIHSIVDKMTNG